MAKQMKRRKAKADKRMVDLRGWAKTFPQIVKMRFRSRLDGRITLEALVGGRWCTVPSESGRPIHSTEGWKRSGNAWAKRMGYKPKWE
jgi:hypothetical protein